MRIVNTIFEPAAIREYIYSLWQTDLFRQSHENLGYVYEIVDQYSWMPRIFAVPTDDYLERAHFCTWWGVLMLREGEYDNPYIHDLYMLHEMYHAARMPYVPGIGKAAFDEKMQRNELEASTMSEIQVYFEIPELRALSFDHPIYADRFLDDPRLQALWKSNRYVAVEALRTIRRDVMVSKPEHGMDLTEQWIRRFAEQNTAYSVIWSDRYLEVEQRMADFQVEVTTLGRREALNRHVAWLRTESAKNGKNIPFLQEAELFAGFYWANKEKYAQAMLRSAPEERKTA